MKSLKQGCKDVAVVLFWCCMAVVGLALAPLTMLLLAGGMDIDGTANAMSEAGPVE